MREVYEMVDSDVIYIVPNFISEGYFCQQVLPRELRLDGATTQRNGKTIHYCDPVGIHPNMTRLLLQRADEVALGVPRDQTGLIIVGHGTSLNENSRKVIEDQVRLIKEGGYGFAEVVDAYMEEQPLVSDWDKLTTAPNVVVVPFFIADGLHSFQDIPVLLGMREEVGASLSEQGVFHQNPHALRGRQLYYSGAIGTESQLAEVILDQVNDFDAKHGIGDGHAAQEDKILTALARWVRERRRMLGQVAIMPDPAGSFTLCHVDDQGRTDLSPHREAIDAIAIARYDDSGAFRALHTAPTLKHGWRLDLPNLSELRLALDFFYPAAVGMALALESETLEAVPLRGLLGRQTGMYRFTNTIRDDQAHAMVGKCCADTNCLRRILWPLRSGEPMSGPAESKTQIKHGPDALPLLCVEACTHIVSAARKIARENHEAKTALAAT